MAAARRFPLAVVKHRSAALSRLSEMQFVQRHALFALVLLLAGANAAPAQDWARKMFGETSHDFGSVARAGKTQYHFKFTNKYEEPLHVSSVRSSCGCTTAEASKTDLKTWETGEIIATFNTNSFLGNHSATLTVTFDRPYPAEVQLQVYGNIRSDVVLAPGSVQLGTVDAGQGVEKKISVTHTGSSTWAITDIRSANTNFEVEVSDPKKAVGSVTYDLTVRLKPTTPVGYVNDQLFLVTNDPEATQMPVDVEGQVVADVDVTPKALSFGSLLPGATQQKNILISNKSKKAFKVIEIVADDCFTYKLPEAAHDRQIIPITFKAPDQAGKIVKKIKIKTDLGDNIIPDITCQATVLDSADSTAPTTGTSAVNSADPTTVSHNN